MYYDVTLFAYPECPDEEGHYDRTLTFKRRIEYMPFPPGNDHFKFRWPEHGSTDEGEPITFDVITTTWEVGSPRLSCHVAWWGGMTWGSYEACVAAYEKLGFTEVK